MKTKGIAGCMLGIILNGVWITAANSAVFTIGTPVTDQVVGKKADISCGGMASSAGLAFGLEIWNKDGVMEQSTGGTTTAPPGMPMNGQWTAILEAPGVLQKWETDTFMPPNLFTTRHRIILNDAAGVEQERVAIIISP